VSADLIVGRVQVMAKRVLITEPVPQAVCLARCEISYVFLREEQSQDTFDTRLLCFGNICGITRNLAPYLLGVPSKFPGESKQSISAFSK
jgi:hypothetical protein